jgi:hypothetical protein
MFLIRVAFWVGLVVLLLPTDERQQARLYSTAATTVERAVTFCDRNAQTCAAAADLWATFLKKAEFGARIVVDLVGSGGRREEELAPVRPQPASTGYRPEPRTPAADRGTLTPADLSPPWRGQAQRTGT